MGRHSLLRTRPAISLLPLLIFITYTILLLTSARIALVLWQWERVIDADMLAAIFVQGLRFDLVLIGIVLAVPALCFPLLASNRLLIAGWRFLLKIYLPVALLVILFMEVSTPSFIAQFDSRPNILFIEYLDHPAEVFSTLWAAYKTQLIVAVVLCTILGRYSFRKFDRLTANIQPLSSNAVLVVTPLLLFLCFAFIRSTTDHRPVNPSTVALSSDPMVNDLALNSTYTVLYAIYELRHEPEGGFRYAAIDDATVIEEVRAAMTVGRDDFTSTALPTLHRQVATASGDTPRNLVIILEESLGAEFVGALGGLDLTPNLDELVAEGIWFENLYATGTRSVRGIEAIVSGFTPTPARSVVKLGKSQKNFFTLAQLLSRHGYETNFIYGGESQFDNMRRFFINNGFDWVIDKHDMQNPVFMGSWGVSDEDLFNRAHAEFSSSHKKPFFSLVFTSSNHSPYEYPDDRIVQYDEDKNTVNNAVKYADFALGRFIRAAQRSSYWEDTVFLIVADHNSRVYGADLVPIERFHIPGLILGGSIKPEHWSVIASQIDLAPTLLSLLGVSGEHPMIGHDLTEPEARLGHGRAIMQYNATQAYMEGEEVVILQKNLPVREFIYRDGILMLNQETDSRLKTRAIAHSAWSSMAYEKSLYRLP